MSNSQSLKGFRDFLPEDAIKRQFVITKFKTVFERFGFDPLETPALERAETLLGKYGEEAEKLMYIFEDNGKRKVGLRYDQTVPTARVTAQYPELPKPFKRYQIQPVWRAENTQKGRYREFLQCDADIIAELQKPQVADAEILALFYNLYTSLGIKNLKISVNSRQILRKVCNDEKDDLKFLKIVSNLDKLDKLSEDEVRKELQNKNIPEDLINFIFTKLADKNLLNSDENLSEIIKIATQDFGIPENAIEFSPTLARGLDYYTGLIFESKVDGYTGSLGGGGRYDNLIKQLGGMDTPAVGFAIGFDRTLEVAQDLKLIPDKKTVSKILVTIFSEDLMTKSIEVARKLREDFNVELFPDPTIRLDKQLKYADKKQIPFVVIIGPEEIANNQIVLKNMQTQEQQKLSLENLAHEIRKT